MLFLLVAVSGHLDSLYVDTTAAERYGRDSEVLNMISAESIKSWIKHPSLRLPTLPLIRTPGWEQRRGQDRTRNGQINRSDT